MIRQFFVTNSWTDAEAWAMPVAMAVSHEAGLWWGVGAGLSYLFATMVVKSALSR